MSERFYHPAFGWLTDEEDIRIAKRQQSEEEYDKTMQKAYEEEYHKMIEKESADYDEYCWEMNWNPQYEEKAISFEEWLKLKYQNSKD